MEGSAFKHFSRYRTTVVSLETIKFRLPTKNEFSLFKPYVLDDEPYMLGVI